MATVTPIGLDIGKHSFHLVGQDTPGKPLLKRQFTRRQLIDFLGRHSATRIVMEACCGAHWLGRKLTSFGHTVQLIAPQYAADARAIWTAARSSRRSRRSLISGKAPFSSP